MALRSLQQFNYSYKPLTTASLTHQQLYLMYVTSLLFNYSIIHWYTLPFLQFYGQLLYMRLQLHMRSQKAAVAKRADAILGYVNRSRHREVIFTYVYSFDETSAKILRPAGVHILIRMFNLVREQKRERQMI